MSGYILCRIPRAKKPFFIPAISTSIYSIEELCYFLTQNLFLVDGSVINEELCAWLEKELGLKELAAKIRPGLGKFASAEDFLYPILKTVNYLSYEELKELNKRLVQMDEAPKLLREKCRGDALMENGMIVGALRSYEETLLALSIEEAEAEKAENRAYLAGKKEFNASLRAGLLHNMGCAYARLFLWEQAAECFRLAEEAGGGEAERIALLLALHMEKQEEPLESLLPLQESGEGEALLKKAGERLSSFEEAFSGSESEDAKACLLRLMRDYHRGSGV